MLSTLFIVLPIFALIFIGYGCRKMGVLGANASTELNRFVVYLALPALLFDVMAHTTWQQIYQPRFVVAFSAGCALIFALTLALRLRHGRHLADASIDGLNAAYANTGFMGFPLGMAVLGKDSLPLVSIAVIVTVCVVFAVAIVLIEISRQAQGHSGALVLKVARSLLKNPLLVAPALGALVAASGLAVPASAETFLKLLGGAASPCALVALGLFLAEKRPDAQAQAGASMLMVGLKLIAHPALTWLIADQLLSMPRELTGAAVLMAALPTGTGPFMLAEYYGREAVLTSRTILLSTIGSVVTLTLYVSIAGHSAPR